jgi:hypothetical protein
VQVKFVDVDGASVVDNLEWSISGAFYNSVISSALPQNKYPNDILIYGNLIPIEGNYLYPNESIAELPLLGTLAHP